ncbi:hypothetical protein [Flavobacterium hungaricum]|uniref:Uncharacterized protein n=1 Tax=Flavobacterium hungaricum TaxID=2082725 RepID=A0ABR9TFY4_9FLAO|nr:hypothetical protein [Flavobacterium hungaricum]MBE8724244.1 hypothetical protein [Flavobacterium hungaricum]
MINGEELAILKKSIALMQDFKENIHSINSGHEFVTIHNRNIETVKKIAYERKSQYLLKRIEEYPKITVSEINEYIKIKKNEISLLAFVMTVLFGFVMALYFTLFERFLRTGKISRKQIKIKIIKIIEINKYILEVIENPYMEKLRS